MAEPRTESKTKTRTPSKTAAAPAAKPRKAKGHASGPNGAGAYAEPGFERPKSKSTGRA